jgi:dihydrofolate reductase
MSLDGVMEGPGADDTFEQAGWTMPYGNDEFRKIKLDELMASEALLLGRLTYEGFAKAWPGRTDEMGFGEKMNAMPKYVVSSTMESADWQNTKVVDGDLTEAVTKLKAEVAGDIMVAGSHILVRALMDRGLVDAYRLLVYPVVVGRGKRLFEGAEMRKLTLTKSQALATGVMLLEYAPDSQ